MKKKKKKVIHHKNNNNDKRHKEKRKWWKKLLTLFIVMCSLGVFLVFGFFLYIVISTGEFDPNALANQDKTIIYDSKGNVIANLGMERRESIKYEDLPQVLIDAIIATEDSRFFQHNGVDAPRFAKASLGQLVGHSYAGGASTLTMQVVKNNLTDTKQTITRKFKDIYLSVFFMEKKYTKEEILEFYVNDSYLGGSAYGVEEASKYYFGKSVSDLSLPEAAIIAGLFQAPSSYNPYNYPENTAKRMKTVLKLMVKHGYIKQDEADIAGAIDISSLLAGHNEEVKYQGFIDYVVKEVEDKTGNDPNKVSMEIHTTLIPNIQDGLNKIFAGEGYNWVDDYVQAGVSVVDVKTGAISALGTGRNRNGQKLYSYATRAKRQPGSTAKPIFAYGPGFEYDNFSTYQLFVDEGWSYSDGSDIGNWDSGYKGLMTLKQALSISRNIPALKAFQYVQEDVGNAKIKEFVNNLGMNLDNVYESYSIGGLSEGVTTLQMASAYAAFANGGYYTEPYSVTSITYRSTGETTDFDIKKKQAMKDSSAYLITNCLEYAARHGFSGGTSGYGGTVAVKTGTSNYPDSVLKKHGLPSYAVNDLWSVAYTPEYSIALWYGYDEISNEHFNSAGAPKDNLMAAVMRHIPVTNEEFKVPNSVVAAQVEMGTWPAEAPSENTPNDLILTEYFTSGTEPDSVSQRFAKLPSVTNLKANSNGNTINLSWNYSEPEITQNDYLKKYFSQRVFGNSGGAMLNERLNYNNNTLGGLGFRIYLQTENGGINSIGFTDKKSFTYNPTTSGNLTFIVKAEYKNYSKNASDNVSVKATSNYKEDTSDNNNELTTNIESNVNAKVGNYIENEIIVKHEGKDVTDDCSLIYTIIESNGNTTNKSTKNISDSKEKIQSAINKLDAGTYKVKYKITYEGKTITKVKTINITN